MVSIYTLCIDIYTLINIKKNNKKLKQKTINHQLNTPTHKVQNKPTTKLKQTQPKELHKNQAIKIQPKKKTILQTTK